MNSRLGFAAGKSNLAMTCQEGLKKPHSLSGCPASLLFQNQLVVRVHCGLPSANLFTNHAIHRHPGERSDLIFRTRRFSNFSHADTPGLAHPGWRREWRLEVLPHVDSSLPCYLTGSFLPSTPCIASMPFELGELLYRGCGAEGGPVRTVRPGRTTPPSEKREVPPPMCGIATIIFVHAVASGFGQSGSPWDV